MLSAKWRLFCLGLNESIMAWHDMLKHKTWALIQYEDIVLV